MPFFFGSQYQPAETFSDDDLIQRANEIKDTSRIGAKTSILTDMRLVLRILSKLADAAEVSRYNSLYINYSVFFKKTIFSNLFIYLKFFSNCLLLAFCFDNFFKRMLAFLPQIHVVLRPLAAFVSSLALLPFLRRCAV